MCVHTCILNIYTECLLCASTILGTGDKKVMKRKKNPSIQGAYAFVGDADNQIN